MFKAVGSEYDIKKLIRIRQGGGVGFTDLNCTGMPFEEIFTALINSIQR
jgi:hypothetical protein